MAEFHHWLETSFWPRVQKTDTCWHWKAKTLQLYYPFGNCGYTLAHRLTYYLALKPELLPECAPMPGLYLAKMCENKTCVNPAHLVLTKGERDPRRPLLSQKQSKAARAVAATRCKLTEAQALECLKLSSEGVATSKLSHMMGVSEAVIHHMLTGRHYRHYESVNELREKLEMDKQKELVMQMRSDRLRERYKKHRQLRRRLASY